MPFPTGTYLDYIRGGNSYVALEFDALYAQHEGYLRREHKDTGAHKDVTADSLVLTQTQYVAVPFAATDFTGGGAQTWTLIASDVVTFRYKVLGKALTVAVSVAATSVGGTPDTELQIAIPGHYTAKFQMGGTIDLSDNGTQSTGAWVVTAGGVVIKLRKGDLSNWTASTNNTAVTFVAEFEIE